MWPVLLTIGQELLVSQPKDGFTNMSNVARVLDSCPEIQVIFTGEFIGCDILMATA
jgi:hypothetical protein